VATASKVLKFSGATAKRGIALLVLILLTIRISLAADPSSLGPKIVEFCKQNLGKQVGNGECSALAFRALKSVGAKTRGGPDAPEKGDYVWGTQVFYVEITPKGRQTIGSLTNVQPGDIIQYRNTKFVTAHFEHHTSVVEEVNPKNLKILQQNVNGNRFVIEAILHVDKLSEGWLRIYRPISE